jgi:hypothetical protein
MQNAAGGGATDQSEGPNESYHSIVSELDSLIERVQASMRPGRLTRLAGKGRDAVSDGTAFCMHETGRPELV